MLTQITIYFLLHSVLLNVEHFSSSASSGNSRGAVFDLTDHTGFDLIDLVLNNICKHIFKNINL